MSIFFDAPTQFALPDEYFKSTFALDYLTEVAKLLGEDRFIELMRPLFGADIATHTYVALYNALLAGHVAAPHIEVVTGGAFIADYDNRDRIIRLHIEAIHYALDLPHQNSEVFLLAVLLHEFGHHIDNVLRQDLSDKDENGMPLVASDAPGDEGKGFAVSILDVLEDHGPTLFSELLFHVDSVGRQLLIGHYSNLTDKTRPHAITVPWEKAVGTIAKAHGDAPDTGDKHDNPDREAFEAGSNDAKGHTHQTLEWVLSEFKLTREDRDAIYFGNWLRDHSQIVDPKITRAPDMPKAFPAVLSREAWTRLVDVLAIKKFPDLRMKYPEEMKVTPEKLGVYRPSEHIDNPSISNPSVADPRVIDPDFEPWVLAGDPVTGVDPQTSMKRYLSNAVAYMQQELRQPMLKGGTLDGLRSYGAALHVLEDLFAHSNFAELSLIKLGHTDVLPWTAPAQGKWNLPLVTGTFGTTDVIASLAAPLGNILFSTQELEFELTQPGFRSARDNVMLILLQEHPDQDYLDAFNLFLEIRDQASYWAKRLGVDIYRFYRWLTRTPAAILINATNRISLEVLTWIGNSVDDAQTLLGSDPHTDLATEATHSQLSKDHAEHPLHDLAGLLAQEAIKQLTASLENYWNGTPVNDPLDVAASFFTHPMDSTWQDEIVASWAVLNEEQVARSQSKTELGKAHEAALNTLRETHQQLISDSNRFLDTVFNNNGKQPESLGWIAEQGFNFLLSKLEGWKQLEALAKPKA